jgi:HD-GYP domain-containing protein (c-di-GMP phosphodiesterase class II)
MIAVFTEYHFNLNNGLLGHLYLSVGIFVGIFVTRNYQDFLHITLALILARVLSALIYTDSAIWLVFLEAFVYTFSIYGSAYLFRYTYSIFIKEPKGNFASHFFNLIIFFTTALISGFAFAAVNSIFDTILDSNIMLLVAIVQYWSGFMYSILLFSLLIIYSNLYEDIEDTIEKKWYYYIFYNIIFILLTIIIYYPFDYVFTYMHYRFIFLLLYAVSAILFNFKQIMFNNFLYVLGAVFIMLQHFVSNLDYITFQLVLFVSFLNFIIISFRVIFLELVNKSYELEESSNTLEGLIEASFDLLKLGEERHYQHTLQDKDYLVELFNAATKVLTNYDLASCYFRGEELVEFVAAENYDVEVLNNMKVRNEDFKWSLKKPEHVVDSYKMVKATHGDNYEDFIKLVGAEIEESIIFCIFLADGKVGGMSFDIARGSDKHFTLQDYEKMATFQRVMNTFYETSNLIRSNNSLRNDIILSLIHTLELYDQYTGGHSEDVAELSLQIAKRMDLNQTTQNTIYWAGIVHDIGKVGIPSEILNKAGRLSMEEYELIKEHPIFGFEILDRSKDLSTIAKLVKHHHEWWNGSGYPDGLKQDNIPLGSRIIGVCDAVSAMATKRPYTVLKTAEEIVKELKLYTGTQFDPTIAEVMIDYIEEGLLDAFYMRGNNKKIKGNS